MRIQDHLRERHVDRRITPVIIDEEKNLATFICYNVLGQMIGYQRYNPLGDKKNHENDPEKSKYFTYISEDHRNSQFWGLHSIRAGHPFIFVVEGIFDAIRLHRLGYAAIAVLTCVPSPQVTHYLRMWHVPLIGLLDNDNNLSGEQLSYLCDIAFLCPPQYGDLGNFPDDLSVQTFVDFVLRNSADAI